MRNLVAIGTLITSLVLPVGVDDPPPNERIVVDVVTVNGSGCRPGTAGVAVSPDNSAFTVSYSEFMAQVGVGALPTDMRKNCQLSIVVHVPQGTTYALTSSEFRGFASLAAGAAAVYRTNYYFQGQSATAWRSHTVPGPFADDLAFVDITDLASLIWAPCGALRNFNINTEVRVNAGTSDTGQTTSFAALEEAQNFTFRLAPCR